MPTTCGDFSDGRPIAARPVGPLARTWRWCRRKPVQAAWRRRLVLALVGGFAGITWNWREAVLLRRAAQAAEAAARAGPKKPTPSTASCSPRCHGHGGSGYDLVAGRAADLAVLDRAAAEVGGSFGDRPEIEAAIRMSPWHATITLWRLTVNLRRSTGRRGRFTAEYSGEDTLAVRAEHGHSLAHLRRLDEAETLLTPAFEEMTRNLGPTQSTTIDCGRYLAALYTKTKTATPMPKSFVGGSWRT